MSGTEIVPGLVGEAEMVVSEEDTARHLGSGHVDVFATPAMIRLMERAGVAAVDHLLPEGRRTVGVHLDVKHLAATPLGMTVRARAELLEVEGRKLTFKVEAFDDREKVGEGTHRRMTIDLEKFNERVERKAASSLHRQRPFPNPGYPPAQVAGVQT
jgi:fluoroacetyl-CoA thioesterase